MCLENHVSSQSMSTVTWSSMTGGILTGALVKRMKGKGLWAMVYDSSTCPEPKGILCTAPESLDTFIHNVIHHSSETEHSPKHEAIMQSTIAATRPHSLFSPLLLGIAVYIHRKYGSKDRIELLNNFWLFWKLLGGATVWIFSNGRSVWSAGSCWFSAVCLW